MRKILLVGLLFLSNLLLFSCKNMQSTGWLENKNILQKKEKKKKIKYHQIDLKNELNKINTVNFDFDQYQFHPIYYGILDKHAKFLLKNKEQVITIEGHADERGTSEYNIALGEKRANSIKVYLQGKGILDQRIKIISYGKERPISLEHNEESYAKNRRSVIVYQVQNN
ncbi:peptidoglycan-associated lipoprotein Pal [bacterium endosymbiont of Pedicinus badii]|uniref:peptidoglycan-associated lipoprotein Pal n=1 Tax=bacterium endosymbiont of Pedicinus badii TaxID=1719126 RepID=UPI0009C78054|nr:peptidoglycan-associated lipoprotein Pal [bacterium endosymbiont of Pedicinus badii]OQM34326.1 hypothetical protein AOQ89_00305 [bacterium endosymbiont of Pedicinus badii]